MSKYSQFEDHFYDKDRQDSRKERKIRSKKDRSKFKKSDQDQKKKRALTSMEALPEDAIKGRVLGILSDMILVQADHHLFECSLRGSLKKEKQQIKNLLTIGDFVQIIKENEKKASIIRIEERKSILSRGHQAKFHEQLIAANVDQVLITSSVILPQMKPHLIDRYILAAKKGNMSPVIVINKIDLLETPPKGTDRELVEQEKQLVEKLLKIYQSLHIPIILVSADTGEGIAELKKVMHGKSSVFSGQSGTGKSSLINRVTDSNLPIGKMIEKTKKGSHTTTRAFLVPIEGDGFCIDTPGIRSFGLWQIQRDEIGSYFEEIAKEAKKCKFPDCTHLTEPGCAVEKALKKGIISPLRFESYCALMAELDE